MPESFLRIRVRQLLFQAEGLTGRGRRALRECPATDAGDEALREALRPLADELIALGETLAEAAAQLAPEPPTPPPAAAGALSTPEPELFAA